MKAIVIGGGIIGLSSAFYLQESGWEVVVIDKNDFSDNCSYGNAGYVCPSHFIPLATPGIVKQGLKWMWNSKSPFYVEPRLSSDLVRWGLQFIKSATPEKVAAAAIPLRDIALYSQVCYEQWLSVPGFDFSYEKKGLLEYFQTAEKEAHSHHTAEDALKLGLEASVLSAAEVQAMEPRVKLNIRGALYFRCDAHLYPQKLMRNLRSLLEKRGVQFRPSETVTTFIQSGNVVQKVITSQSEYTTDLVVVATGSWTSELVKQLHLRIPMVAGRGYSVTLENSPFHLNYPAVLQEGRVAITPMDGNKIRFGGTMEITSLKAPPRMNRVKGILESVQRYLPEFNISMPAEKEVWYGYRPCSADGLPYIGRIKDNVVLASGHAMIGLSLGAGTGKLVAALANHQQPEVNLSSFDPLRFS